MISEIIKTDCFFVGNKGTKSMYLLNKLKYEEEKIHTKIDRKDATRRQRKFMRKCCFEIYLFDDDFDYKIINKSDLPDEFLRSSVNTGTPHIKLKTHTLVIIEDSNSQDLQYRGYYRGEEKDMIKSVKFLYDQIAK
jgi:hypothetical protein